jgi:hypothetical protein
VAFFVAGCFAALALMQQALVAMVCASCLVLVVALVSEAGSRPAATRFLLSCQKKPGKEKARLAGGCPAELTARVQRSVQKAAGNMRDFNNMWARRLRTLVDLMCCEGNN